ARPAAAGWGGTVPRTPPPPSQVEYRDGTRGTVLLLNGHLQDFTFAARLRSEARVASCLFVQPGLPGLKAFDCLASVLERFFESGQPPAPIERTLLTSGVLEMAMESHARRGIRVEPSFAIAYRISDESFFCRSCVPA